MIFKRPTRPETNSVVSKTETWLFEVYGEWDESATPAVQPVPQQTGAERCELASSWDASSLGFGVVLNGKFTLANVSRRNTGKRLCTVLLYIRNLLSAN